MNHSTNNLDAEALDFAPGLLRINQKPPSPLPRAVLYSLLLLFFVLLLWAIIGKLDVIAVAEGKLVPQTYLKIVQPAESGIVQEVLVKEGQEVASGDVLVRMNAVTSLADGQVLQTELARKALQLRRINAELSESAFTSQPGDDLAMFALFEQQYRANRQAYLDAVNQERAVLTKTQEDLAAANETLKKLRDVVPMYREQEQAYNQLAKDGHTGKLQALDRTRERVEKEQDLRSQVHTIESLQATIVQTEKRLAQITSIYQQQLQNERVEAQGEYDRLQQEWVKQAHRHALLELKAPQAGTVKDLATHTPGTVVSPGAVLMSLVPKSEPLHAEIWISNEDSGFVHAGQTVKVKLASYPFQKYGMVDGVISHISADATDLAQQQSASFSANEARNPPGRQLQYKGIVTLKEQHLATGNKQYALQPGMQVMAEVNLGQRTIMEYLLSPAQKAFHEAGRER